MATDLTSLLADLRETRDYLGETAEYENGEEGPNHSVNRGWRFTRRADAVDAAITLLEKTKE